MVISMFSLKMFTEVMVVIIFLSSDSSSHKLDTFVKCFVVRSIILDKGWA